MPASALPKHVVVIPDGNRRWAKERGLPTFEGHRRGFSQANKIIRAASDWGIHTMTFWAFSTDNWKRDKSELDYLMKLYEKLLDDNLNEAIERGGRIIHLGRKDRIPESLAQKIAKAEERTRANTKHILNVALDYGGRDELLRAVKKMLKDNLKEEELTPERFSSYLDTGDQPFPNPDFIIRTSGELRLSGILPWQSSYAELYFTSDHFPDFTVARFKEVLLEYGKRQRRFGGDAKVSIPQDVQKGDAKIIRGV